MVGFLDEDLPFGTLDKFQHHLKNLNTTCSSDDYFHTAKEKQDHYVNSCTSSIFVHSDGHSALQEALVDLKRNRIDKDQIYIQV